MQQLSTVARESEGWGGILLFVRLDADAGFTDEERRAGQWTGIVLRAEAEAGGIARSGHRNN